MENTITTSAPKTQKEKNSDMVANIILTISTTALIIAIIVLICVLHAGIKANRACQPIQIENMPDVFYVYGNDMETEAITKIANYFNVFPDTYQKFVEEGGRIVIGNGQYQELNEAHGGKFASPSSGFYKRDALDTFRPKICIKYHDCSGNLDALGVWQGHTEIHEMAHYMDHYYNFSFNTDFIRYFYEYAEDYNPISSSAGYQTTNIFEFFAVLATDIILIDDVKNLNMPEDLEKYMAAAFMKAEGMDIYNK